MISLNADRFAQIKRLNGDVAVLRMLVVAQKQGATPQDVVSVAKDIGIGATNMAKLKAQVGWTAERRKAKRDTSDRRVRERVLDRSREKKAIRALIGATDDVSFTVYPMHDDGADEAMELFSAYGGQKLEHDIDHSSLFLVREIEHDERLFLVTVDRANGRAQHLGTPIIPADLASHVDEETFADIFPKVPSIDAIDSDEVAPLLISGIKGFDL
jgi:hypothetical protein